MPSIFTGGIGQGSAEVRALALQGLDCMGIHLDETRNRDARGSTKSAASRAMTRSRRAGRAHRRGTHDGARSVARHQPLRTSTRVLAAQKQQPFPSRFPPITSISRKNTSRRCSARDTNSRNARDLSQPGQFACKEQLAIVGPKGRIERVRVLGPARKYTQIEIAMTEQFKLGVHPPIRESGDIADTPGCTLEGPAGSVALDRGVICALRHIHMTPADALRYGVRDKSFVRVRIAGDRELVFGDVLVRVDPSFALAMHIDTDEANAANVRTGAQGYIEGIQSDPQDS